MEKEDERVGRGAGFEDVDREVAGGSEIELAGGDAGRKR